eukprot:CAMPEP_0181446112 /NCGR_PEP_ID=MMETSP1110-20121109/25938_1 /TAXON_ID=174948 /ORGANISM="Symbiodinium sp., Strain CCMP421" /LENGTH=166 /DNA_ID=CAMNT_0023570183 /DNA_START=61 /DNA_END=558 /DNA_ORIENTATION=-
MARMASAAATIAVIAFISAGEAFIGPNLQKTNPLSSQGIQVRVRPSFQSSKSESLWKAGASVLLLGLALPKLRREQAKARPRRCTVKCFAGAVPSPVAKEVMPMADLIDMDVPEVTCQGMDQIFTESVPISTPTLAASPVPLATSPGMSSARFIGSARFARTRKSS